MDDNKKIKVLWLDDDIENPALRTECMELEQRGYQIYKAPNPDVYDEFINSENEIGCLIFDCCILDISLPLGSISNSREAKKGMRTGFLLLKELLKNERYKDVPKVIYTIVEDKDIQSYCEQHGVKYINKEDCLPWIFADHIDNICRK